MATDANAEVFSDEVGQDCLDLHTTATTPALICEGCVLTQQMVVAPVEIRPRQVSNVGTYAPTVEQHGVSAEPMRSAFQSVSWLPTMLLSPGTRHGLD
ncbi:hypothetical protein I6F35_35345 [Bradyrhizobium sp. BRP22]|uniref:hypothetical protein n=1 Tax=Bradyrhizobium sp. BRP22 TaxID=2793821 RepID=UPI001CD25617|nr:hypothetical protein [Bradyrhizobium sp. BRP22]MCA1458397.1 hypothetical protein [Bradyrhizobium sp. BRP22]